MLSVVVLYESRSDAASGAPGVDAAECLVRTLSSLVRANVEGLVRDVAIAGPHAQGLDIIADHAGCGLIEAGAEAEWLPAAIAAARQPHILLIRSGFAPQLGFVEEAGDFLQRGAAAGAAVLRAAPERLLERLLPRAAPVAGLIAPRELRLRNFAGPFAGLVAALAPATTLRTQATRVG